MKIFANTKNIWKKILIIFVLISSMSFVAPKKVEASIGGELMEPVCNLLVGIGDSIVGVIHDVFLRQEVSVIRVNVNTTILDILKIVAIVAAFLLVVVLIVAVTGGVGMGVAALGAHLAGTTATVTFGEVVFNALGGIVVASIVGGGWAVGKVMNADVWDNEEVLPLYSISPEEIFRNNEKLPLFDVNFFEPNEGTVEYSQSTFAIPESIANGEYTDVVSATSNLDDIKNYMTSDENINMSYGEFLSGARRDGNTSLGVQNIYYYRQINNRVYKFTTIITSPVGSTPAGSIPATYTYSLSYIEANMEEAYNGEIHAFSFMISDIVSRWYYILRMMAIVGMMSVLVYIGIRILISSTSSQQAKYKQLLWDWFVGMILLFTMHYIMVFSNKAVKALSGFFNSMNHVYSMQVPDTNGKVSEALTKSGFNVTETTQSNEDIMMTERGGTKYIEWDTNLMGAIRMNLQHSKKEEVDHYLGYTLMFLVMVFYLVFFAWTYTKRLIYMAFLTLISPLVALTYPIDKVNDGRAQGFNYWFKEYIFNLLLQPMHLLIYTILVSMAIELAGSNWIYSLVALGFIASAEKIVRTMFNFQKASTPGVFAGPAGAALTMTGMRWLLGHGPRGGKHEGKKDNGSTDSDGNSITSSGKSRDVQTLLGTDNLIGSDSGEQNSSPQNNALLGGVIPGNTGETNQPTNSGTSDGDYLDNPFALDYEDDGEINEPIEDYSFEYLNGIGNPPISGTTIANNPSNNPTANTPLPIPEVNDIGGITDKEARQYIADKANREKIGRKYRVMNNGPISREQLDAAKRKIQKNRALGNAVGFYKDGIAKKLSRNLENAQPIRALGRLAGGAAIGATFGTIGLAAGIASGDVKNATQYAGAGIAGGYKLGSGMFDSASQALTINGAGEEFNRSYYGAEEYKKRIAERNQLRKANEEATIRKIQEKLKLSRKKAKERAVEMSKAYMEEGIDNVDDWIRIEKMKDKEVKVKDNNGNSTTRNYSREEAIAAYKIHKRSGFENKEKKKAIETIQGIYNLDEKTAKIYYNTAKVFDDIKNS